MTARHSNTQKIASVSRTTQLCVTSCSLILFGLSHLSDSSLGGIPALVGFTLWSGVSLFAGQLPVEHEQLAKGGSEAGLLLPKFAAGKWMQNA